MCHRYEGEGESGDYLEILILADQLFPGEDLISLDAFKAVLSLFILRNTAYSGCQVLYSRMCYLCRLN